LALAALVLVVFGAYDSYSGQLPHWAGDRISKGFQVPPKILVVSYLIEELTKSTFRSMSKDPKT